MANYIVAKRTAQESGQALAGQVTERADAQAARTGTDILRTAPDTVSLEHCRTSRRRPNLRRRPATTCSNIEAFVNLELHWC